MRKLPLLITSVALFTGLSTSAGAAIVKNVQLNFESGATYTGSITFDDNLAAMLDTDGVLTGGSYGTRQFSWTWWANTSPLANPVDYDAVAGSYEDWLMDGTYESGWATYLGLSWLFPNDGQLEFRLGSGVDIYYSGINRIDRLVSYSVDAVGAPVAVSEPATLALFALGLAGMAVRRNRRQSTDG